VAVPTGHRDDPPTARIRGPGTSPSSTARARSIATPLAAPQSCTEVTLTQGELHVRQPRSAAVVTESLAAWPNRSGDPSLAR
jgi:hypothetical protein